MKAIPYGKQHIEQDDIDAVVETLQSDFLTQGPKVQEFEKTFAEYVGAKYALAVCNGTVALHLATLALGVNGKSKVITTPITFAASANCVRYCGGEVVLVDIDPQTFLIDIHQVEQLLKSNPVGTFSGLVVVDFAGKAINLEEFKKLATQYNLWIIEDACHAPGAFFKDKNGKEQYCGNGNFADISVFSFHPVKHIATGEGGMITTNNKELYQKMLLLRTHGITKDPDLLIENHGGWYYEMQELGFNYRISDILCALGLSQLKKADKNLLRRKEIAKHYSQVLKKCGDLVLPQEDEGHAYHLYIIKTKRRKALYDFLKIKNIFTQVHYLPIHKLPYYQKNGFANQHFDHAEEYYATCLSLPMYANLTNEEQNFVITQIENFYSA